MLKKKARSVSRELLPNSPVAPMTTRSNTRRQQQQLPFENSSNGTNQDDDQEEEEQQEQDESEEEEQEDQEDQVELGPGSDLVLGDQVDLHYPISGDEQSESETGAYDDTIGESDRESYVEVDNESDDDNSQALYPDAILENLTDLNLDAERVINHFLKSSRKGNRLPPPQDIQNSWKNVMGNYTKGRCIDPQKVADILGISADTFAPIFRKANLAVLSYTICANPNDSKAPSYFGHGGLENDIMKYQTCAGMTDEDTFKVFTAWRTQKYIRGLLDNNPAPDNWPERCFFGAFCTNEDTGAGLIDTTVGFLRRLQSATFKGWESENSELPEKFRKALMEHLSLLHMDTNYHDQGVVTVDTEALKSAFSYDTFQNTYLAWLKKILRKINSSEPSISSLLDIADECDGELEILKQKIEELTTARRPINFPKPTLKPPIKQSTNDLSRRTTIGSSLELQQHLSMSSRLPPNKETMNTLKQLKKQRTANSGRLQPPTSSAIQQPISREDTASSSTAQAREPVRDPSFNINHSLRLASERGEKENKKPAEPRRFNQSQEERVAIVFDDDEEIAPTSGQRHPQSTALQPPPPPQREVREPSDPADDGNDSIGPGVTSPGKRRRDEIEIEIEPSDGEQSDDFSANAAPFAGRKKPRHGPPKPKGSRFDPSAKATVPRPSQPTREPIVIAEISREPVINLPLEGRGRQARANRREWSNEDIDTLMEAVADLGGDGQWAKIRDNYFNAKWSNIDCKDKARNIKFNLLK
ncbi:hypothetical protein ABW20_dc0106721 [Dactylellina cionopaga]|nr:hypothetical protein ABW20_dc0106721 [Dactylellina cionopaga]